MFFGKLGKRKRSMDPSLLEDERILKKYKIGRDVDDEDLEKINELASIGLIKKGLSLERLKITAKTTELGLKFIIWPYFHHVFPD